MKIIENFKTFRWSRRMRKIARKLKRRRQMIGLDLAKSVGIYFHYDGKASYETVNKFANYLRNRGISAMLLAYSDSKEKPTEVPESPNFGVFTKSELGSNRIPLDVVVNRFVKQPFDIFFDLSLTDHFQNLYVANASHATFKVGRVSEWGLKIFDFTLEIKETTTLDEFINIILGYFEVFNQTETAIDLKNI
ncbi:MAG: hypothetical protein FWE63_01745 [Bacteroidales bacterium]|nr:hypothetical protein [Bacteroidales bacterium]